MDVFISWSGPQSKAVATALRAWLRLVLPSVNPWMSDEDIEVGARWGQEIIDQLARSRFGVVCLTAENLRAPWLMFEAGALVNAVKEKPRVSPYLYDLEKSAVTGPLADFQMAKANETETYGLVRSINRALDEQQRPEGELREVFDALWTKLADQLAKVPTSTTARPQRKPGEILEDLLALSREQLRATDRLALASSLLEQQWVSMIVSSMSLGRDPTFSSSWDLLSTDAKERVLEERLAQLSSTSDTGDVEYVQYLLAQVRLQREFQSQQRSRVPPLTHQNPFRSIAADQPPAPPPPANLSTDS